MVSGVRNSWEILAKKRMFISFTRCSCSFSKAAFSLASRSARIRFRAAQACHKAMPAISRYNSFAHQVAHGAGRTVSGKDSSASTTCWSLRAMRTFT